MVSTSVVSTDVTRALGEIGVLLGDRVSTAEAALKAHGEDFSWHRPAAPQGVCFPETDEEVSAIVRICAKYRTPIIPFGAGSSLEGGVLATQGGISVDMTRMNRILQVSIPDMDCTIEGGVRRLQLNERLAQDGVFFPVDPGADATLAGMAATRASGTNAMRYGTMRENVVSLKVVLADGRIIHTGSRARKSAAGYDLTRLFVGSEGTLGIITGLTLRLHHCPAKIEAAVVSFPDLAYAIDAVIKTRVAGLRLARIELLDALMMKGMALHLGLPYPEQPTLFLEFNGTPAEVEEQVAGFKSIAAAAGGEGFEHATTDTERERLWHARHNAYYASLALRPGCRIMASDVCVPMSNLLACIESVHADVAETTLLAPMVGHIGDGNFHMQFIVDPDAPEEIELARKLHKRLIEKALAFGGTCTGEHGVGIGKTQYLEMEYGAAYGVLQDLKKTLDPANIMNPGKVVVF